MYLKSLTLKGFKSFASATTLQFEPGITAVVGPNGSGKSNVVDAIAWVLGEQGAKALRGGKMEDVIFAGTADRPPLGRAEVTLTIDNSDGALPIDFTEVSITRRMFRDGAGEYEINGSSCRLLDIQELLSDSGIGREMHVIVGQGQLDAVLSARPEDRRAFIEEAAGVLKHRKRKEKALRKLDAMQANLTRLTDLTGELRRQLKPLGRQAEVARRAAGVQADLRDARLRLLADDLVTLADQIAEEAADEEQALAHRAAVQQALATATAAADAASADLAAATPALQQAQDTWFALSALAERVRGTVSLAEERARNLAAPMDSAPTRTGPRRAGRRGRRRRGRTGRTPAGRGAGPGDAGRGGRRAGPRRRRRCAPPRPRCCGPTRAVADRREGLARLSGQVNAARSRAGGRPTRRSTRLSTAVNDAAPPGGGGPGPSSPTCRMSVGDSGLVRGRARRDARESPKRQPGPPASGSPSSTEQLRRAQTEQAGLRARLEALSLGPGPAGRCRRVARCRATRFPACWVRSPPCSTSGPGTRWRWRPRSAPSPTPRWPASWTLRWPRWSSCVPRTAGRAGLLVSGGAGRGRSGGMAGAAGRGGLGARPGGGARQACGPRWRARSTASPSSRTADSGKQLWCSTLGPAAGGHPGRRPVRCRTG